jgi:glycosyltransferase involved in cell wall biosynthesis
MNVFFFLCIVKILILHQHFNTPERGGAIRSYYLAKALIAKGHDVIVISGYNGKEFKKENIEGINVHYLPIPYQNKFGFAARSGAFLRYVLGVIKRGSELKDVDTCYTISVPLTTGIAALWIKFRYKISFIFEVGDLWPDAPIEMGVIKNPIFKALLFRLEKYIYQESKFIVALSPAIKKVIENKIAGKRIHLITNMADTDFFKPQQKDVVLEKKFNVENKFVVAYIGALGVANGLNYFLECARASQKADLPIEFILCGEGGMKDNLKRSAGILKLHNLSFIDFKNRDGVQEVMNVTDAAFICYKPLPILETGSPNKYFDALSAGKLIVINFGGWIKEEIEKNMCGVYIDSKHPTDFIKKIMPFLEDIQLLNEYQSNSRLLAERCYSRKALGEKFADLIKST